MKNFLHTLLLRIIRSFWLIPSLLAVAAIGGSFALNGLDHLVGPWLEENISALSSSSADGALTTLSTIAGSMITVTGVLLSTMVVVLTLTSQQYGPRLVKNFIEDRPCQFVIGFFAGCFIYCIITLKNVESSGVDFVPHISLAFAVLLAIVCIGLMIFFVQHISSAIQVQSIMRRVYRQLNSSIDQLFPEEIAHGNDGEPSLDDARASLRDHAKQTTNITAQSSEYLQFIQQDELMACLREHNLRAELRLLPGAFARQGAALLTVYGEAELDEETERELRGCFALGRFPTSAQDAMFPIRQLEEIAIRALSPGINDPHTAVECLDYLTSAMQRLSQRNWPSPLRRDDDGELRLIAEPYPFETMLRQAFQQIHFYGREDISIVNHVIHSLNHLASRLKTDHPHRAAITAFNRELAEASQNTVPLDYQRAQIAAVTE